jgi:hypothetical protein
VIDGVLFQTVVVTERKDSVNLHVGENFCASPAFGLLRNSREVVVVCYRRFGTTYRSHIQGPALRKIPEERTSNLHGGGSLKSNTYISSTPLQKREIPQRIFINCIGFPAAMSVRHLLEFSMIMCESAFRKK